jgi:hypothetical protein
MADAFLDSSVLIGLVFRHAGERAACQAALSKDGVVICSRYVLFEVARGFLRSLIVLHNASFEFGSFADLHQAAHSGQQRFRQYRMHTWLGAFDGYFAELEREDGVLSEALTLEEFRAKVRGWIRRGWRRMEKEFNPINRIGCREDLPPPAARGDHLIDQALPDDECGQPDTCGVQAFIETRKSQVAAIVTGLETLPESRKDAETEARIDGLRHLLSSPTGASFDGKKCHRCGDALICLEAPEDFVIVTKNRKHFELLVRIVGKALVLVDSARSSVHPAHRL